MSGQAGYFLAMGLAAMALATVAVALTAAGYYGGLESRLRNARQGLAAMEAGLPAEAAHNQVGELSKGDTGAGPSKSRQTVAADRL